MFVNTFTAKWVLILLLFNTSFWASLSASESGLTPSTYYLHPINDTDIPKFLEETSFAFAKQAWRSGMFTSEDEALALVTRQTNEILEKITDTTFLEQWKHHNFLLHIFSSETKCGYIWYSIEGKEAFIENIFLEEAYRGKGIAKAILNDLETQFKVNDCACIRLHVFTNNEAAFTLYKKLGYKIESTNTANSINMIKVL